MRSETLSQPPLAILEHRLISISRIVAVALVLFACSALVVIKLNLDAFSLVPDKAPAAAVAIVFAGISLSLKRDEGTRGWRAKTAASCAFLVLLFGILTVSSYFHHHP